MPSYFPPKKGVGFIFYTSLIDTANRPDFKSSPTLSSDDFKVSKDGGSLTAVTTTPTVTPASGALVKITLSSDEMNADNVAIVGIDAAGAEWDDIAIGLQTTARQIDDIPTSSDIWAFATRTLTALGFSFDTDDFGAGSIKSATMDADMDIYQAKVVLVDDDTGAADLYTVTWFKNGEPITVGITSPTIQVIKVADGTDLIASTAMTQIGALGMYKKSESTNRIVDGAGYIAKVQATIASATRTWLQPVGRDS